MDNFKEEEIYLEKVITRIDEMLDQNWKNHEEAKKTVEDIGFPTFEERAYFNSCKQKIINTRTKKIALNKLKDNPYFGRMDLILKEEDSEQTITMYLGEKSINSGIYNMVYDWRSPVGNLYYMGNQENFTYNDAYYKLLLKRQIKIENSKLIKVYDSYVHGRKLNVMDTFLQDVLEEKKNRNEFTDIIKTIQGNQNQIIRDDLNSNVVVQGVAGSGKTVVLLHRLSYLFYNYKNLNKNKLVFITPSRIFNSKLSKINRSLSLTDVKMITMEEYYLKKLDYYLPIFHIDNVIKDSLNNNDMLKYIYSDAFNDYLKKYIINYKTVDISLESKIKNVIDKGKYNNLDEKEKLENELKEIKKFKTKTNIKKIFNDVYKEISNQFNNKNKPINKNICEKYVAYIIILIYKLYGFETYNEYEYMFIDEMQDYAFNEYRLINGIEKRAYLSLYGDVNQNILDYIPKREINEFVDLLKSIKNNDDIKIYKLLENYRNSKQVIEYCNNNLKTNMISMGINSDEVKIIESNDFYNDIINNFNKDYVILTDNPLLEEQLHELRYEVYSVKMAKGLEFSKIVLVDENLNTTSKYVGYTRTLDKLIIMKKASTL